MLFRKHTKLYTRGNGDVHDLTEAVGHVVEQSGVQTGLVNAFVVGSTAAVGTIEFEPGLQHDLPATLNRLVPPGTDYAHEQAWHDGNAHSHLQSTLVGPSVTVPIEGGCLLLGSWQQIVLLDCDNRPRERTVVVTVMGE
jgi:secondary thiamine-phosphate synthase enzyme